MLIAPAIAAVVFSLIALFLLILSLNMPDDTGFPGLSIAAALFIGSLLCLLLSIINYKSDYIILTDTQLIGKTGFIRTKKLTTPLSKVQNLGLSNGLMGKIFHFHTITIATAGTGRTEYVFTRMADADKFVDIVNDKIA